MNCNKKNRTYLTDEEKKEICDLYLNGLSSTEITKKMGKIKETVRSVLIRYNIPRNSKRRRPIVDLSGKRFDKLIVLNRAEDLSFR